MFSKILVANRGEIACRIIKTAKKMGISTVAIYSDDDRDSLHVRAADIAIGIGASPASASYLNSHAIIKAAIDTEVQAIHPGYGFLSENSEFAKSCAQANIVFIGPSSTTIETMASKQIAKKLLDNSGIPLIPGYHGDDQSEQRLLTEAIRIGFPVIIKPAAGGGGKGMRTVSSPNNFLEALAGARREANASFGDEVMIIEKLVSYPRHIEWQIMADNHGQIVHLFHRDCSIQRRHQKIIEEAPAPNLPLPLQRKMADAAITIATAINYRGAGTIEFLLDQDGNFYFMEMNTRLQVEHPVTEMITGLDLVEWQLRIAADEKLPKQQDEINHCGHAFECRIYAEDPSNNFLPSTGLIHFLEEPNGPGIRIDSGIINGSKISVHYDPMIAKLVCWGHSRQDALRLMISALEQYHIGGIKTNIPFLHAVCNSECFKHGNIDVDYLANYPIRLTDPDPLHAACLAAGIDYLRLRSQTNSLQNDTFAWQMHLKTDWIWRYRIKNEIYTITVVPIDQTSVHLKTNQNEINLTLNLDGNQLLYHEGHQQRKVYVDSDNNQLTLYHHLGVVSIERISNISASINPPLATSLKAPMPGTIIAILKKPGDTVNLGEPLLILEAMKMEHTIYAPRQGKIELFMHEIGSRVNQDAELVALSAIINE
ncbi:MAG: acetyl-CoA carboxylase biotin carboxylase subunit [Legionella sp.]